MNPVSKADLSNFRKLYQKKFRRETGLFPGEGIHLFEEVKRHPGWISQIMTTADFFSERQDLFKGIPSQQIKIASSRELQSVSGTDTAQPVLFTLIDRYAGKSPDFFHSRRVLYLHQIQDPGNAGTLIRTAAWFGWDLVIFSFDSADWTNPKVIRSTMGAFVSCPVFEDTPDGAFLHEAGKQMAGYFLDMEGTPVQSVSGTRHPVCLVVGNESNGFQKGIPSQDFSAWTKLHIPGYPDRVESLNAGIAGSIALFQLRPQ